MSDTYQAIYDATRSRLSNCDVSEAVLCAVREAFNFGNLSDIMHEAVGIIRGEHTRPSVLFSPKIYPDGDMWCALLGENLASGVAGFGRSPCEAMNAFDQAFHTKITVPPSPSSTEGGESR